MKKSRMKRCLATLLATAVVVTSLDLSWAVMLKAADESTTKKTEGQIIAENYEISFTAEEIAILNSDVLNTKLHEVQRPTKDTVSVAIDDPGEGQSKTVYANHFKVNNTYTWVAESFDIQVEGMQDVNVVFQGGTAKYDGKTYDATQTFTCDSKNYKVSVNYKLYISIANQLEIMNIPYYLADTMSKIVGTDQLQGLVAVAEDVDSAIDGLMVFVMSGRITFPDDELGRKQEQAYEDLIAEFDTYGSSELTEFLNNNYKHQDTTHKMVHIIEKAAEYREVANRLYDKLVLFKDTKTGNVGNGVKVILESLDPVVNRDATGTSNPWPIESMDVLKKDAAAEQYTQLDILVRAAIGKCSKHTAEGLKDKLLVDTVTLEYGVNLKAVEVQIQATVYGKFGAITLAPEVGEIKTLYFPTDTAKDVVMSEVETIKDNVVAKWNRLEENYQINETNYTFDDAASREELSTKLTKDITYSITITPKQFLIEKDESTENAGGDLAADTQPYGKWISLPKYVDEPGAKKDQAYIYTIEEYDGEGNPVSEAEYYETAKYRVVGRAKITRELGMARDNKTLTQLIAGYSQDNLTSYELNILNDASILDSQTYEFSKDVADELLTLTEVPEAPDTLKADLCDANADGTMQWKPEKAVLTLENGQEAEISFQGGNEVQIAETYAYTQVEVIYKLVIRQANDSDVISRLNIPYDLVQDAKTQLKAFDKMVEYVDQLPLIKYLFDEGERDLWKGSEDGTFTKEDTLRALDALKAARNQDSAFYLVQYINEYINNGLESYYVGERDEEFKTQIDIWATNFEIIVADQHLPEFLNKLSMSEYYADLQKASTALKDFNDSEGSDEVLPLKDDRIVKSDSLNTYEKLVASLKAAIDYGNDATKKHTEAKTLAISASNSVVPQGYAKITIVATKDDANAESAAFSVSVRKGTAINDVQIGKLLQALENFKQKYPELTDCYNLDADTLPTAGTIVDSNATYEYVWTPKTYKVNIVEGINVIETISFVYGEETIVLKGSGSSKYIYAYEIGNQSKEVQASDITYTLYKNYNEFKSLFGNNESLEIARKKIDVTEREIETFIHSLNDSIGEQNTDAVALIPFKDGNKISVVLRLNYADQDFSSTLADVMETLAKEDEVTLGKNHQLITSTGKNEKALLDMILNSGFGSQTIDDMIDENGDIIRTDVVAEEDLMMTEDLSTTVYEPTQFGGLMMTTTLKTSKFGPVDFYITMEDFGTNKAQLSKIDKLINRVENYIGFVCEDGELKVSAHMPEKLHEAYLAAMVVEGRIDIHNFTEPSFMEMVDYLDGKLADVPLTGEDALTVETFLNTVAMLREDADLSEYTDILEKLLGYVKQFRDGDTSNGEICADNAGTTRDDLYAMNLTFPLSVMSNRIGLELEGEYTVPTKVTLNNCNDTYTALVVDVKAEGVKNKIDLVKTDVIQTTNKYSVVVLLESVEKLIINGMTVVDLNGQTIGTLEANAKTVVLDSNLPGIAAGTIRKFEGNTELVALTAGTYGEISEAELEKMLPDNYEQIDKTVSNKLYRLVKNGKDITIEISTKLYEQELKDIDSGVVLSKEGIATVALEIAADVMLNVFTWGGLSVIDPESAADEETMWSLYNFKIEDALGIYDGGVKDIASMLVGSVNQQQGVKEFANSLVSSILDFQNIADATAQHAISKDIIEYTLQPYAWDVNFKKVADGDYLTVALIPKAQERLTLSVKIGKANESTTELHKLATSLAEIINTDVCIDELMFTYDAEEGFDYELEAHANVEIDFSKNQDYLAIVGIILANGLTGDARKEVVAEIEEYLLDSETENLIKIVQDTPTKNIILALKAAKGTSFEQMIQNVGLDSIVSDETTFDDLGDSYDELLSIAGKLIAKLDITGGDTSLPNGTYAEGELVSYEKSFQKGRIIAFLKVILAKFVSDQSLDAAVEVKKVNQSDRIYNSYVDQENKVIYLDTHVDGVTFEHFKDALELDLLPTNAQVTAWKFAGKDDVPKTDLTKLVCTGDTITIDVTASTEHQMDTASVTYRVIVMGDTDSDGVVWSGDASDILKVIVGKHTFDDYEAMAANNDEDAELWAGDASNILKKCVDKDYHFKW